MDEYDKQDNYAFTAPLFDKISGEKERNSIKSDAMNVLINYISNNRCFDVIKDKAKINTMLK